ncbi:MAG: carboxypeptidase regulatory-like domain-containing protein [Pirellulaceae bacterium]|nr:carboxypeptidase regulatory-like domain-containing protein [Pirellulaceae bacterium]
MRNFGQRGKMLLAWLAVSGWLLPITPARADSPPVASASRPVIHDVRLDSRGSLQGRMIDLDGQPAPQESLELLRNGQIVAQTVSGADGQFEFAQVPAGVYQIRFGSYMVVCRVWTEGAAPPAAKGQLTVLSSPPLVRGQQPASEIFRNPLFIGLIVAAAIAIPVAVHNSRSDSPSGS